jgi:hypothetical protein
MPFDTSNLPISGGVILAAALYAGVSFVGTGQVIAKRTIEKSDWGAMCQSALRAENFNRREPVTIVPSTDCNSLLGGFMPELRALCNQYGNPDLSGGATGMLREQERQRRAAEDRRISLAASKTGSRCDCAASVVTQDRLNWAILAGSGRLISPISVTDNLNSELTRALHSSHCALR